MTISASKTYTATVTTDVGQFTVLHRMISVIVVES
jgi:hypothetical protein